MTDIKEIKVEENNVGERLDTFLASNNCSSLNLSRTYIKKLIEEKKIKVNEKIEKASYKMKLNDIVKVNIPKPIKTDIEPENIKLNIIYEDDDIIIVNKPRGMVVHPALGNYTGTLVNGLLYNIKNLSNINGIIRPGIVHRIDKDTSGILVVAKNDKAHQNLSEQFKVHSITRKYIAIVKGKINKEKITIDAPIGRSTKDRKKMDIIENGKKAITHIKLIDSNEKYSLIEAILETGRTHQIRVHLSTIGHPLIGDTVYGNKENEYDIKGQALHAKKLGFIHPTTKKYIEFEVDLPDDMKKLIKDLKLKY